MLHVHVTSLHADLSAYKVYRTSRTGVISERKKLDTKRVIDGRTDRHVDRRRGQTDGRTGG